MALRFHQNFHGFLSKIAILVPVCMNLIYDLLVEIVIKFGEESNCIIPDGERGKARKQQ